MHADMHSSFLLYQGDCKVEAKPVSEYLSGSIHRVVSKPEYVLILTCAHAFTHSSYRCLFQKGSLSRRDLNDQTVFIHMIQS